MLLWCRKRGPGRAREPRFVERLDSGGRIAGMKLYNCSYGSAHTCELTAVGLPRMIKRSAAVDRTLIRTHVSARPSRSSSLGPLGTASGPSPAALRAHCYGTMDAAPSTPPPMGVPTPSPLLACRAQAAAEASLRCALAEPPTRPPAPCVGPGVVLIACGSFSPLTTAHVDMLGTLVGAGVFGSSSGHCVSEG